MNTVLGTWTFDLFVATNLAFFAWAYAWAVTRVNGRFAGRQRARSLMTGRWPVWPTVCYFSGLLLIALVWLGPMAAWSHTFFWVHMTQHLVITMAAAPLIVLGAPITLAYRASNSRNRRVLVRVLRSRPVRIATDPILTWVLFAGVLVTAHFTPFYDWILANHGSMVAIEQPMFLLVSLLYYLPLLGTNLLARQPSHAVRLISLGLMMIPEATIGAVIYFSPVILYDGFDTVRPFGLTALADQQLSGALMWGLVMTIDAFWMMWVAADWFTSEERRAHREDAAIRALT
ncbi:MAG: cytochrome c oxidase assembly protein [Actinomycetales bacterium]